MDIKSQAKNLSVFLSRYASIWKDEVMNDYPTSLTHYPSEWVKLLLDLPAEMIFEIDQKHVPSAIEGSSFAQFMRETKNLSEIPFLNNLGEIKLEEWAYNGVKAKKKHEIQKIIPTILEARKKNNFSTIIDIGGGVGHLSRILSHYHCIPSVSIDQNAEFQKIGEKRLKKYRQLENASNVSFVNHLFGSENEDEVLKPIFSPDSFCLGLHTCGSLANTLINHVINHHTKGLLNFGCCYYRINSELEFPLSKFYIENHFPKLNLYALTLATRSHAENDLQNFKTKERVKYYRYALHLFLIRFFNKNNCTDVGECPTKNYWLPFPQYIKSRLNYLKIPHEFSDDFFENFYNDSNTQAELKKMFICNIIRWQLGRALEVYLLLDRALYLIEKNFDVRIEQYFEEALSPRNIGILALSKS